MYEGAKLTSPIEAGSNQSAGTEVEITLVVPVYEEEANIVPFVREVKATLTLPYQIVIIYDHDGESALNKREDVLAIDPTVTFIRNTAGQGVINAFITGFNVATTRYVV